MVFSSAVELCDCLADYAGEFDVRCHVFAIGELFFVAPARGDGRWHINMNVFVENLHRQTHLRPPHSVKDVDCPPYLDAMLALGRVDELGFGDVVIQPDCQTHSHGISNQYVRRMTTVEIVGKQRLDIT